MKRDPWNPDPRALSRVKDPALPPVACDCCSSPRVRIANNREVYGGQSVGKWPWVYLCDDCGARVGLHPGTDYPLGTMADARTRLARTQAKGAFNRIWQRDGGMSRAGAYAWLAFCMGIERRRCHFGMFDVQQCERARDLSIRYLERERARVNERQS